MMADDPPRQALWLLRHVARRNDDLEGDLLEEYRRGRSDEWYWRQVLIAVVVTRSTEGLLFVAFVMVYLVGHRIPLPHTNAPAMALSAARVREVANFRVYDLIAGGNLAVATVFALGIYPFIIASVAVQVLAGVVRAVTGRTVGHLASATWMVATIVAARQAYALAAFLERQSVFPGVAPLVYGSGPTFEVTAVLAMMIGFVALMGLSDYVSSRGLGNGMLIAYLAALAAGAVTRTAPTAVAGVSHGALAYLVVLGVVVALTGTAHGRALRYPHTA